MIFRAELWAFQKGAIRKISVPDELLCGIPEKDLEKVFYYGQNEVQPVARRCSLSVGDVIQYKGRKYQVKACGFEECSGKPRGLVETYTGIKPAA